MQTAILSSNEWKHYRSVDSPFFGAIPVDDLPLGEKHSCPYLPEREAQEQFLIVNNFPPELYHDFMDHGFRRSGDLIYRPICHSCRECKSLRVAVEEFRLSKHYRRVLKKNEGVEVKVASPRYSAEKQKIYSEYLAFQHDRRDWEAAGHLRHFLYVSPVRTLEFEYRLKGRLVAVSIADVCRRSLSSVYAYFDPEYASRSLGTFSALHEILFCLEKGLSHYYLGYMVSDCRAMNYKTRFKPYELLGSHLVWQRCPLGQ